MWLILAAFVSIVVADVKRIQVGKDQEVIVQSEDYPQPQAPGEAKQWELAAEKNFRIQLECEDIRTSPSPDCELGYLRISNADKDGKYCDLHHNLKAVSKGNTIKIEFALKRSLGVFRCRAITVEKTPSLPKNEPNTGLIFVKYGTPFEIQLENIEKEKTLTWNFKTDSNFKLSLYCTTILIPAGGRNCETTSYLKTTSGHKKSLFCNYGYNYEAFVSETNEMEVEIKTKDIEIKDAECIVQAISGHKVHEYQNIVSYEIESKEHGMNQGEKKTTCPCGAANKSQQTSRVINGRKAGKNEFPFAVSLQYAGTLHLCGGAIITANHVLSAAHCTHDKRPELFKVLAGKNDHSSSNGQIRQVVKVVTHEFYNRHNYFINDISILIVEQKFEFGKTVMPVCLPKPHQKIDIDHKYVTVMGWGVAEQKGEEDIWPEELLKAHVRVVDYPVCNARWDLKLGPTSEKNRLCTWASDRDSCSGDSGGPLVWIDPETNRYTQVGIVSFGQGCNTEWPKINTLVQSYYNWIQDTIKSSMSGTQTCERIN